mmetsp:Transcript_1497/g.2421  ORF Transcript_1497/g.2421 Transcript_1497/m.2421 type:complete len:133 (-) Transcript_1497:1234-1632(-)
MLLCYGGEGLVSCGLSWRCKNQKKNIKKKLSSEFSRCFSQRAFVTVRCKVNRTKEVKRYANQPQQTDIKNIFTNSAANQVSTSNNLITAGFCIVICISCSREVALAGEKATDPKLNMFALTRYTINCKTDEA